MAYDFTTLPDRWNAGAFKYEHMKEKKPDVSSFSASKDACSLLPGKQGRLRW